jgi:hypothetical protein
MLGYPAAGASDAVVRRAYQIEAKLTSTGTIDLAITGGKLPTFHKTFSNPRPALPSAVQGRCIFLL